MKKYIIYFFIILFTVPFVVFAETEDVSVTSVIVDEENSNVSANGMIDSDGIHLDATLKFEGDCARYIISIQNNGEDDYHIQFSDEHNDSFLWTYEYDELLKANTTQDVMVTVQYEHLINPTEIVSSGGTYVVHNDGNIIVVKDIPEVITENPQTGESLILIGILIGFGIISFILIKSKKTRLYFITLSLLSSLFVPCVSKALEEEPIEIPIIISLEVVPQQYKFIYTEYYYNWTFKKQEVCTRYLFHQTVREIVEECGYNFTSGVVFRTSTSTNYSLTFDDYVVDMSFGYYYKEKRTCLSGEMVVEVYDRKKKKKYKKRLMDVGDDDLLLAWNFDDGCYEYVPLIVLKELEEKKEHLLLKFDDGSFLDVAGEHRIFNADQNRFTEASDNEETPIGMKTIRRDGSVITLVSKEVLHSPVVSCCVITEKHFNVFANDILTSVTFNNLYPIHDMKYVKEERKVFRKDELDISDYYYDVFRIGELSKHFKGSVEETKEFIHQYVDRTIKCNILKK